MEETAALTVTESGDAAKEKGEAMLRIHEASINIGVKN